MGSPRMYHSSMAKSRPLGEFDAQRELDEVVGPYRPGHGPWIARAGRWIARALLVACLAIAVVTAIVYGLHSQMKDAETAPVPQRPVTVTIVPGGK